MRTHNDKKHIDNFQYGNQNAAIEFIKLPKGKNVQFLSELHQIIFVSSGTLTIFHRKMTNKKIKCGESVLIPIKELCVLKTHEDVNIMSLKLDKQINLHDYFPLGLETNKQEETKEKNHNIGFLKSHQRLIEFVNMLENYVKDGIKNTDFYALKIQEFFLLIQTYYNKHQIGCFFAPIYNNDFIFTNNVFQNFDKIKTAKELADVLGYSLSGFEKKFKKVFNISPYQWMLDQRAKKIYQEVSYGPKTFTRLSEEHGFSSPAHFNDFCRIHFGYTPGDLRKAMKTQSE